MMDKLIASLTNAPFMFHSINSDNVIEAVSDGWLKVMEYKRDEVLGRRSVEFLTDASCKYASEIVLPKFWITGTCENIYYQFVTKSGKILDVLMHAISITDDNGQYKRSFAFITDITDRINAECELRQYKDELELLVLEKTEQLREAKELYKSLAMVSPVGMFKANNDGEFIYVNEKWCQMSGTVYSDVLGHRWIEVVHKDDSDRVKNEWVSFLNDPKQVEYESEYRINGPSGKIVWIWVLVNKIICEKNGYEYVGTATDITNRKEFMPQLLEIKHSSRRSRKL